jgi:hypothetical protein
MSSSSSYCDIANGQVFTARNINRPRHRNSTLIGSLEQRSSVGFTVIPVEETMADSVCAFDLDFRVLCAVMPTLTASGVVDAPLSLARVRHPLCAARSAELTTAKGASSAQSAPLRSRG